MKKRIASLLLAAALCCGLFALPAQAVAATQSEMLQVLAVLGVMNGDKQGNLNLTSPVTRAEFAKMAVTASSFKDLGTETTGVSPFSDVPHSHWAAGYITTARNAGWLSGYLDGTFRPSGQVTLAEALTVVLKMLGYTDADFTGTWPSGQMTLYRSLQLDANISASAATPLTRLECAWLLYNALGATTKAGAQYGPSMGCPLDAGGKPDYLALINSKLQGPYVVTDGSWSSAIGFTPKTVYRNDAASSSSQIERYDVLYYYKPPLQSTPTPPAIPAPSTPSCPTAPLQPALFCPASATPWALRRPATAFPAWANIRWETLSPCSWAATAL